MIVGTRDLASLAIPVTLGESRSASLNFITVRAEAHGEQIENLGVYPYSSVYGL